MTRCRYLLAALFIATVPILPLAAQAAPAQAAPAAVNLTGKWLITITTSAGGTATPTVTLTQKGDSLTGRYSSQLLGEANVAGKVGKDGAFEFRFEVQGVEVVYAGRVESQDTLKGIGKFGDLGSGPFTAKRE